MSNMLMVEGVIASIQATATGDNVIVATQGTADIICVHSIYAWANTATANQVVGLQISGTTGSNFVRHMVTKGDKLEMIFGGRGWMLTKNTGLDLNLATAGSIAIDVNYSVYRDF